MDELVTWDSVLVVVEVILGEFWWIDVMDFLCWDCIYNTFLLRYKRKDFCVVKTLKIVYDLFTL